MSLTIGFIGGGNMSTAIVEGILKNNSHPASRIWVSGPHLNHLQRWQELGTNATTNNKDVLTKCDIVFLGVKPGMLDKVTQDSGVIHQCSHDVLFVSMLAGVNIKTLKEKLKPLLQVNNKEAIPKVVRIMPNTPIKVGAGACLITPDELVSYEQCDFVEKLLSGSSICEQVPESMMDTLGCLTACGPAFVYIIIEALADGAVKQGVPRATALRFAAQMVAGSGQMAVQLGKHPGQLKDEVCSAGGSTICGVAALENGAVRASMINAIEAAVLRTKEIGKQ